MTVLKWWIFQPIVGTSPGTSGPTSEPREAAEPELARPLLQRLPAILRQRPERVAELVEVRVARVRERGRHVHLLTDVRVPVVEHLMRPVVRRLVRPRARKVRVRQDEVLLHRGERRHRLEHGAGRIGRLHRAIQRGEVLRRRGLRRQPLSRKRLSSSRGRSRPTACTSETTPSRGSIRRADRARRSRRRAPPTRRSPARG